MPIKSKTLVSPSYFSSYRITSLSTRSNSLSKIISNCTDFFVHLFYPKSKTPFKKIYTSAHKKNPVVRKSSIVIKDKTQQQIDDILDKISKSGYDSLSVDEKEFLFNAGK